MKKIISLLLTLTFLVSSFPMFGLNIVSANEIDLPDYPEIILPDFLQGQELENTVQTWYTMDNPVGTTEIDSAVDPRRITIGLNGTSFVPNGGIIGGAAQFNGTSNWMQINRDDINNPNTGFLHGNVPVMTLSLWIKPETLTGKQSIFVYGHKNNGGMFLRLNDANLEAGIATGTAGGAVGNNDFTAVDITGNIDKWMHVAVVFNSGDAKLYLNGRLQQQMQTTGTQIPAVLRGSSLGNCEYEAINGYNDGKQFFKGMIDDFRLYNISADPKIAIQKLDIPTNKEVTLGTEQNALELPATIKADLTKTENVDLTVSEWNSIPVYNPNVADTYVFTPELTIPDYLHLKTPVSINVTVGESDVEINSAVIAARNALSSLILTEDTTTQDVLQSVIIAVDNTNIDVEWEGTPVVISSTEENEGSINGVIKLTKGTFVRFVDVDLILPRIGDVIGIVSLQSASRKNHYITNSSGNARIDYQAGRESRELEIVKGLADSDGVSFRLRQTENYLKVSGANLVFGTTATTADKEAATFNVHPGEKPVWADVYEGDFESYSTYNDNTKFIKANTANNVNTLSLGELGTTTEEKLTTSFKKTGDNTDVIENLRGAVYYPTYSYNSPQFFKYYDSKIVERDMKYAKSLGINAYRLWLSYEYWLEEPEHFKAAYDDFLEKADENGILILPSLFEGCSDGYEYDDIARTSRYYADSVAIASPSRAIFDNNSRWNEPKEFVTWMFDNYKDDHRHMAIEIYNEPWGSRENLAMYLLEYAVTIQGSVPISFGTAPSGGGLHSIRKSVQEGVDIIQYHDNFPGSAAGFKNFALSQISDADRYNLPVYCTEVQWIGGPGNPSTPHYANLAPTCEELMETGKWAPFYWNLMMHPAFLPNNRVFSLQNGIFQEDGSVWGVENAKAIAPEKDLDHLVDNKTTTYQQYYYKHTFSDDWLDKKGHKWITEGEWDATTGAFAGNGTAFAELTKFANLYAEIEIDVDDSDTTASAGLLFKAKDKNNAYYAEITQTALNIVEIKSGTREVLATTVFTPSAKNILKIEVNGVKITATVGTTTITANSTTYAEGLIGLNSFGGTSTFDNLIVDVTMIENPAPNAPQNVRSARLENGVNISWETVRNADSYTVKRAETKDGVYTNIATDITTLNTVDTTASPNIEYFYTVTSKNANGESAPSNPVLSMTKSNPGVNVRLPVINTTNGTLWVEFEDELNSNSAAYTIPANGRTTDLSGEFVIDGKFSNAFMFNGIDDSIKLNEDGTATGLLHTAFSRQSISLWICPYTLDGKQVLYKQGGDINGISIRINNGNLEAAIVTGDLNNPNTQYVTEAIPLDPSIINTWTHIALTFDEGKVIIYINGEKKLEGTARAATIAAAIRSATLGAALDANAFRENEKQWYHGMIDDVRIYNNIIIPELVAADASNECDITAFTIPNQVGETVINQETRTIAINMPFGTNVTALTPTITISEKATVSPASGAAQNFTESVKYTVTAEDTTTTKEYTVTVTVLPPLEVPIQGVTLNRTTLTLNRGANSTLTATVNPTGATNVTRSWSSSRPSVATVDTNGRITAVARGTAVITFTAVGANNSSFTATCNVTVNQPATGVSVRNSTINLNVGKQTSVNASIAPSNANVNTKITYRSENTKIATVSSSGRISGRSAGRTNIVITGGGKTVRVRVNVKSNVTRITFKKSTISSRSRTINLAKQIRTITPAASFRLSTKYTWVSSNRKNARVSSRGVVTRVRRNRTTTITVRHGKKLLGRIKIVFR